MFPESWTHERLLRHCFAEILTNQHTELEERKHIMATLQDVLDKLNKLSADVDTLKASHQSTEAADLDQVAAAVDAVDAKVNG